MELAYSNHSPSGISSRSALLLVGRSGVSKVREPPFSHLIGLTRNRWLIANDRGAEAADILTKYHAGGDRSSPLVIRELAEITETIRMEQLAKSTGWGALVATPGNRKRLFIAVSLGAFAQWNGIGVVSYYLTLVLDTIGITDPFTQTLINGLLQVRFLNSLMIQS
jgi:Sugar (and other) transporter